jgi:hypothetical protein
MSVLAHSLRCFLLLILCLTSWASAECGSLVTYRQHSDLLESAPKCLRDGCSQTERNITISSPCPTIAPCSTYWNMFVDEFDQKHAWCSECGSDLACRIPQWPVMNATKFCQNTPNQVLFGEEGCCSQGEDPFQLAKWTATLCNGSEWREQFEMCGGMACLDWREWIMPWNWTVQNNILPQDQQICKAPSNYLTVYAVEHIGWLIATILVGYARLGIARHEEANNRSVFRYLLISIWTKVKFTQRNKEVTREKFLPGGEHLRPPITDHLKWGFPIIMGVILAGVQLGFNFWVANTIKSAPGYDEVPLVKLAFLFCCRPRLSWLSCLLALLRKEWLVRWFKFKPDGDGLWAARLVLSSVAVSSAVTEAIMQAMGAYFLGMTAHIGRQRGFYIVHHLRPKLWGRNARRMYLGALCWLMLCIPLLVIWLIVAFFFSQIYHAVSGWRGRIFNFMKRREDKIKPLAPGPVEWLLNYLDPGPEHTSNSATHSLGAYDQPFEYYNDLPLPYTTSSPFVDQPMEYGGPAYGELFTNPDQPMPARRSSRRSSRRSQYSRVTQSDFTDQPMMVPEVASGVHRVASGGYIPSSTMVQRRTASGGQYNSIAQADDMDAVEISEDQPLEVLSQSPLRHEVPIPSHRDASNASLLVATATAVTHAPSSSENSSSNKRSDFTDEVILKYQGWENHIIFAGAFLGILAYIAQWVFWDGFVKASGDRFCPPDLLKAGSIWTGGSFICEYSILSIEYFILTSVQMLVLRSWHTKCSTIWKEIMGRLDERESSHMSL